ncbi:hypothetical protein CP988_15285 [Enterococcus faecium]|nr:hypothetical protein CP988_15285 [Enterococcus faecium]
MRLGKKKRPKKSAFHGVEKSTLFYLPFILFICIICQIKRDKTFHLRNSKKLLMVFGNLVIF